MMKYSIILFNMEITQRVLKYTLHTEAEINFIYYQNSNKSHTKKIVYCAKIMKLCCNMTWENR